MTSEVIDRAQAPARGSWMPGGDGPPLVPEVPMTLTLDATTAVDRYLAALNEPDAAQRRRLIEQAWSPHGSLTDPPLVGEGHEGLAAVGDAFHQAYAGHRFERTSEVDEHHGRYRFAWALLGPDGSTAVTGMDTGSSRATAGSVTSSASSASSLPPTVMCVT